MSYIDYLNSFNKWVESNTLPASSELLYYKLLYVFNRAGWLEHVQVDTLRLMAMLRCQKDAAYNARDKLAQAGFISFKSGKKGMPTLYFLSDFQTVMPTVTPTVTPAESPTESPTHIKTKTKTKNIPPDPPEGGRARVRFVPPTVEEVRAYCLRRENGTGPEAFVDFCAAKGRVVGRSPMRDWQAAFRSAPFRN